VPSPTPGPWPAATRRQKPPGYEPQTSRLYVAQDFSPAKTPDPRPSRLYVAQDFSPAKTPDPCPSPLYVAQDFSPAKAPASRLP
jgi:hypothetical protein